MKILTSNEIKTANGKKQKFPLVFSDNFHLIAK